jgi:hypothetical protein
MGVPPGLMRMVRRTELGSFGLKMRLRAPSRMGESSSMLNDQAGKRPGTGTDGGLGGSAPTLTGP